MPKYDKKGRVEITKGGAANPKANVPNMPGYGSKSGNQLMKGKGNKLSSEAGHRASGKNVAQYADVKKGRREDFGKGDGSR
jgi:hypothetical protein